MDPTCNGKVVVAQTSAIASEGHMGSALHGATFVEAASAGPHALFGIRDRFVCQGDDVWIVSCGARRPALRIRRYATDGRLLRFVDTTLPPAELDKHEFERVDPHSVREEDGRIRFEPVIFRSGDGRPREKRRELFEVVL